jgi:hypothetical protein
MSAFYARSAWSPCVKNAPRPHTAPAVKTKLDRVKQRYDELPFYRDEQPKQGL